MQQRKRLTEGYNQSWAPCRVTRAEAARARKMLPAKHPHHLQRHGYDVMAEEFTIETRYLCLFIIF
jgi:hypothetical protein